jgi:hypothetical protein
VAFARDGAKVAADPTLDDPGGEPGVLEGGGCRAGLEDPVGSSGVRAPVLKLAGVVRPASCKMTSNEAPAFVPYR